MAEINLLPKESRAKKPLIFNKKILLAGICVILFLLYLSILNFQASNYLRAAEELRVEIADYRILVEDIEEIKAHGELLERQIQIYSELLGVSSSWGEKLEDINKIIPQNSFITAVNMEDDKFLMIVGYAPTMGDIAAFINHLNDKQYYVSVRLHSAMEETRGEITLLRYEIVCGL